MIHNVFVFSQTLLATISQTFNLFSEEQIKQRKIYEEAERKRDMEITRQLVSLKQIGTL